MLLCLPNSVLAEISLPFQQSAQMLLQHPGKKRVCLSGFGSNFDLKPIWSGHVLQEAIVGSGEKLPPSLAGDDTDNLSLATRCMATG